MRKKFLWMVASGLMALSLVMAACSPAATPTTPTTPTTSTSPTTPITPTAETTTTTAETTGNEMITVSLKKLDGTTMTRTVEKAQYGGSLTVIGSEYLAFDPYVTRAISVSHMQLTSNELMQGKYEIGKMGTGEENWFVGYAARIELETGELAESWELPDSQTIIYHIRKGVKWQNKPPVNGRELTAYDVAWWLQAQFERTGLWQNTAFPIASGMRPTSFKALDRYTVEVKVPAISQGIMLLQMGDNAYTSPPEIWNGTGPGQGQGMGDWKKVVGSGPFILQDYVPGSAIKYVRNPDYFEYSAVRTQDRLPYVDTLTQIIMPDPSTREAAFRTGKVDFITSLDDVAAREQLKQHPEVIQSVRPSYFVNIPSMRLDKPPFSDLRVRQAMNMAVNKQELVDLYYGGDAELHSVPFPSSTAHAPYYTPFDQLPESVKMLYRYDPDKAKKLLAEAGYPNGFKTSVICSNTAANVDILSVIAAAWAKVGVTLVIDPKESVVWANMNANKSWTDMIYGSAVFTAPDQPVTVTPGHQSNFAFIDDRYYDELLTVVGRDIINDPKNFQKVVKEAAVYTLASAWGVWMPRPLVSDLWWPWVKDYDGIYWHGWANMIDYYKYIWIDQSLKKSMGH